MDFAYSERTRELQQKLTAFMEANVYPAEKPFHDEVAANRAAGNAWKPTQVVEELKRKARAQGLWNLFLPESQLGAGLSNLEYAPLCEVMGRSPIGPESFNCSAPDTGNMEVLVRYANDAQKKKWMEPLLDGKIRSAFLMTEPAVASSDATNIEARIERDGEHFVVNGRKWWTTGAPDPRCTILIFMGKELAREPQQAPAAVHDPGADGRARREDAARAHGVRRRRRAPRPRRDRVHQRAGAGREPPAGRGPRLRDRAGTARSRAHPPLHAHDRRGRARARAHVQAGQDSGGVRQARGRAHGHARADRAVTHQGSDQWARLLTLECRVDDGHRVATRWRARRSR